MSDPINIPNLGPFILIQAAVAAVIIGSAIVAMLRGRNSGARSQPEEPNVQQAKMYFDGPLVAALRLLESIERTNKELLDEQRRFGRETLNRQERMQEVLRDIRGGVRRT